jgi:hypothetical protein
MCLDALVVSVEETPGDLLEARQGIVPHVETADDADSAGTVEESDNRRKETTNDVLGDGHYPVEGVHGNDIQTDECDRNVDDSSACHMVRSEHATVDGTASDDGEAEERFQAYPSTTVEGHFPTSWVSLEETWHDAADCGGSLANAVLEETCRSLLEDNALDPPIILPLSLDERLYLYQPLKSTG